MIRFLFKWGSMKKLFLSQPMNGLSREEIEAERGRVKFRVESVLGEDVGLLDSVFAFPDGTHPLVFLGESLKLMSQADIVCFCEGWDAARGCMVEHRCAVNYGLFVMYPDDEYIRVPDIGMYVSEFLVRAGADASLCKVFEGTFCTLQMLCTQSASILARMTLYKGLSDSLRLDLMSLLKGYGLHFDMNSAEAYDYQRRAFGDFL